MKSKLTEPQRRALKLYDEAGLTTSVLCHLSTWERLLAKGYLRRSAGLGFTETEITDAGRAALEQGS